MIRRILNPDQSANNFLKINKGESWCCGDSLAICQYDATYTQANTVSVLNLTEDGVAVALPCVPATTSAADVQAKILAVLLANGYEDDSDPNYPGVTVVDNGSTLTVTITGDVVVVSLTTSGGAATFNQDCTIVNLCTYTYANSEGNNEYTGGASGAANTALKINGVSYNLGAITPGSTTAGAVKTAIETQMTTAGVSGTANVTAVGSTHYTVEITGSEIGNTFSLGGQYLTRSNCAQSFV